MCAVSTEDPSAPIDRTPPTLNSDTSQRNPGLGARVVGATLTMAAILGVTVVAVSVAIAVGPDAGEEPAVPTPPPAGSSYSSVSVTGKPIPGGGPLTVAFPDTGRIALGAGCNRHIGAVDFGPDSVTIGQLASTLMACPPPRDAADAWLSDFARGPLTWRRDETTLTLSGPDSAVVLTEAPPT